MSTIKPQKGDIWQGDNYKIEVKLVGEELLVYTDALYCREYAMDISYLLHKYKLIERDGKPFKKELTGEELVGRLCKVTDINFNGVFIDIIVAFVPKDKYPYKGRFREWFSATEILKDEILKLKNFEE